jgi:hypothetical protein
MRRILWHFMTLNIKAFLRYEMSVTVYQSTMPNIPEDLTLPTVQLSELHRPHVK